MQKRSPNEILLIITLDLLLTEGALYLSQIIRLNVPLGQGLPSRLIDLPPLVYVIVAVLWLALFSRLSLYQVWRRPISQEILHVTLAVSLACMTLAGVLYLSFRDVSRLQFFYFCGLDLALLITARIVPGFVARTQLGLYFAGRVLIVGAGKTAQELARQIGQADRPRVQVIGFLDDPTGPIAPDVALLGGFADIMRVVIEQRVTEVIFALPFQSHARLIELVTELRRLPILISVVPDVLDIAFPRTRVENAYGMPLIRLRDSAIEGGARVTKRLFDMVVASLLLIILSPLLVLITVLIKLDSKGPALIMQERIGENARPFRMLKFRSMVADAEQRLPEVVKETDSGEIDYKRRDDPRITRVGRFIRRFSLDELPQLLNVLKGEMSLVGPRPELPWLVDRYEFWQWRRFAVPPGMTGWWQIQGRSDRPMHLHVGDDLYYIQNYSLWLDWQILLKTIVVVLKGQGAY